MEMTNQKPDNSPSSPISGPAKHKISSSFIVLNDKGLHTRPATELVKCTARFKARVTLSFQEVAVNAKSLLGILMLAAGRGSKVEIEAEGEDASEVVKSVLDLAANRFNIRY